MKFKCRTWYCGKYYYGYVVDEDEDGESVTFCEDRYGDYIDVRPQDVERFLGYDCDGKEVYGEDKVINSRGATFSVKTISIAVCEDCDYTCTFDSDSIQKAEFKLKSQGGKIDD